MAIFPHPRAPCYENPVAAQSSVAKRPSRVPHPRPSTLRTGNGNGCVLIEALTLTERPPPRPSPAQRGREFFRNRQRDHALARRGVFVVRVPYPEVFEGLAATLAQLASSRPLDISPLPPPLCGGGLGWGLLTGGCSLGAAHSGLLTGGCSLGAARWRARPRGAGARGHAADSEGANSDAPGPSPVGRGVKYMQIQSPSPLSPRERGLGVRVFLETTATTF